MSATSQVTTAGTAARHAHLHGTSTTGLRREPPWRSARPTDMDPTSATTSEPTSGTGTGRGHSVGAGITLIFMAPLVLVVNIFLVYAAAVHCAEPARDQGCTPLGWTPGAALVLPVVMGIVCIVTGVRGRNISGWCWFLSVVGVITLLAMAGSRV
jgi:hypothetical protein